MGRKTATVTLDGDASRFAVTTGSGHELVVDTRDGGTGPSPAELMPVALAGCTAMDVIAILRKKRQVVTAYEVRVVGEQRDAQPAVFTGFEVEHVVEGPELDVEAVRRSIELSATRYCAVGGTLATGITEIHHRYRVRIPGGETTGEVVVTGPGEDPDALGRDLALPAGRA
jgi:putative redox protein